MEGEEPSRRGGMKYKRSRSLSGLLSGYPGISQGPRSRLGEAEDEEWEESMEEEEYDEIEVEDSLGDAPEALETTNITL
ncbi:hypothetical protein O181_022726 [Austropuccinia psidii MF-1]|uniref:Uncharacterized protein n=1 Tax=Austropuccinia psidii MF-1 TaxID=1389203 RepID=A0A9Q3GWZ0_9BASI|nr:hypothetical protein [Austropuccinia psidii MF-1]